MSGTTRAHCLEIYLQDYWMESSLLQEKHWSWRERCEKYSSTGIKWTSSVKSLGWCTSSVFLSSLLFPIICLVCFTTKTEAVQEHIPWTQGSRMSCSWSRSTVSGIDPESPIGWQTLVIKWMELMDLLFIQRSRGMRHSIYSTLISAGQSMSTVLSLHSTEVHF